MKKQTAFVIAMTLSIVGILCFVAGQPRMDLLPGNWAHFAGIAAFLLSGLFWVLYGMDRHQPKP